MKFPPPPEPPALLTLPMLMPVPLFDSAIAVKLPLAPLPLPPVLTVKPVGRSILPPAPPGDVEYATRVIAPPLPLDAELLEVRFVIAVEDRSIVPPSADLPDNVRFSPL